MPSSLWFSSWFVFSAAIGTRGIRVNTVNPATVKTDMFNKPDGPGGNAEKKQAVSNDNPQNIDISCMILQIRLWPFFYHPAFARGSTVHVISP